MNIALDFDDTITADPIFWAQFIELSKKHGHEITVVTIRFDNKTLNREMINFCCDNDVQYLCTAGKQKSHCFKADIWIDDMPLTIPSYSALKSMSIGCENNGDTEAK